MTSTDTMNKVSRLHVIEKLIGSKILSLKIEVTDPDLNADGRHSINLEESKNEKQLRKYFNARLFDESESEELKKSDDLRTSSPNPLRKSTTFNEKEELRTLRF